MLVETEEITPKTPITRENVNQVLDSLAGPKGSYEEVVTFLTAYNPKWFYCIGIVRKFDGTLASVNYYPGRRSFQETSTVHPNHIRESLIASQKSLDALMEMSFNPPSKGEARAQ